MKVLYWSLSVCLSASVCLCLSDCSFGGIEASSNYEWVKIGDAVQIHTCYVPDKDWKEIPVITSHTS